MTVITSQETLFETVATIFAVTVLLDHRTRDTELIEFTHACLFHSRQLRPDVILSRAQLLDWFEAHKDAIIAELNSAESDDYKVGLLSKIEEDRLRQTVLSSIFTISVCDYELHDEESDFIKQALSVWDLSMPPPQEVERVA